MIKLYIIRHGRQNSPLCNVNVPLADEGIRQAKLVAARLKEYDIKEVYASNLIRARETGEVISKICDIPLFIEEDLREISFGALEGLSDVEIKEKFGEFVKLRAKATEDIPCPEGESGEEVFNRAFPVIERIVNKAISDKIESIAIVSHGGVIRSLVAGILGGDFAKKLCVAKNLENCSITEIDFDEVTGNYIVERINDYSHIEVEPELLRKHFKKSL